jgi:hypothetical protein
MYCSQRFRVKVVVVGGGAAEEVQVDYLAGRGATEEVREAGGGRRR